MKKGKRFIYYLFVFTFILNLTACDDNIEQSTEINTFETAQITTIPPENTTSFVTTTAPKPEPPPLIENPDLRNVRFGMSQDEVRQNEGIFFSGDKHLFSITLPDHDIFIKFADVTVHRLKYFFTDDNELRLAEMNIKDLSNSDYQKIKNFIIEEHGEPVWTNDDLMHDIAQSIAGSDFIINKWENERFNITLVFSRMFDTDITFTSNEFKDSD